VFREVFDGRSLDRTGGALEVGSVTVPTDGAEPLLASSDDTPRPGDLKIKERRSWKTWQLLAVALVAVILGMWINGDTGGTPSATGTSSGSGKLPPPSSASAPATAGTSTATTTTAAGGSTTTTAAGGSTTTTAAGGSTTTTVAGGDTTTTTAASGSSTAAAGPARVLLTSPQLKGNWTSTSFTTTAAPWNIGWAFRCAPAPVAGPSFQVFVTPVGSPPTGTPAISETGPSGQSVTAQSSLGAQTLVVQSTATCTWIVKVTGT
jgi:hypothetical protein